MEMVDGRRWAAALESPQELRDRWGEVIVRFVYGSLWRYGLFNADPHPGNYLFHEDGGVTFIDFGCVKRFRPGFVERWASYVRAVVEERRAEADDLIVEIGFVPDPDRFDFDYHYEVVRRLYEPFWRPPPFRFNRHYVERTWRAMFTENLNKLRMNLPADFLFLTRLQWGLHFVLAELEAEADWRTMFRELIAVAADRA